MPTADIDVKPPADSSSVDGDLGASPSPKDDKSLSDIVAEVAGRHGETVKDSAPSADEGEEITPETEKEEPSPKEQVEKKEVEETEKETTADDEEVPSKETPASDDVPFHNHPRWKEVQQDRETLRKTVEDLKPKAEVAETLARYCQAKGITDDDVRQALELAALARTDVVQFRSRMKEYLENIDISLGDRLPEDLQQEVTDGVITEARAKELARYRLQLKQSEAQGQSAAQREQQALATSMATAIDGWEKQTRASDPDYDKRRDLIQDRVHALWYANPPKTVKDAIGIVDKAYRETRERLSQFQPKPQKRKVLQSNGSSANNGEAFQLDDLNDLGKIVTHVANKHR